MMTASEFEIFLVAAPGLEAVLCAEAKAKGFRKATAVKGGVTLEGGWPEVWRANLEIRGAGRVLARIGSFRALHLAQLDKRARRVAWRDVLRKDVPFRVEVSCTRSKIYHSGAAAQRIETAIREELGAPHSADAEVCVRARIDDDLCTIGVDTSGDLLHRRGHKEAVAKAPMRETMASLFLRQCGFDGREPVVDPMCGSGTFVIEAAEIAAGLDPGRSRRFAFEQLATFDAAAWQAMRAAGNAGAIGSHVGRIEPARSDTRSIAGVSDLVPRSDLRPNAMAVRFCGSDRDGGAIEMSRANAERAGVTAFVEFRQQTISELAAPIGSPGLVIVNPPYGARIGDKHALVPLYRALGQTLLARFAGWRVGLITSEHALAKATGLPFTQPFGPVSHGGLRVWLFKTGPLP